VRPAAVCGLLVAIAMVSACSSAPSGVQPDPTFSPNPHRSELVVTAGLDPCPSSVSVAATGGLPDVTLPCLGTGPAVHLAGLRGKPTVVNIWGSWCTPCQQETTYLSRIYDAMKAKVRFLGVDDEDDPNSALDFAPHVTPPMHYPSVVDDNKAVLIAMHTSEVPITIFVDANGNVVHRNFGPYADVASLRADIGRYLGVQG
jgi:cytochrome c biogenesis protein CcmG/thiol:disulfide interchange protein DsbE